MRVMFVFCFFVIIDILIVNYNYLSWWCATNSLLNILSSKNCKRQILRLKLPVVYYDLSVVTSMLSDSLPISGTNSQLYHICDILISVNLSSEYFGTCTESSFCRCTCKVIRCRNEITAELYDL